MKKVLSILAFFLLFSFGLSAQSLQNQYLFNGYSINPAVAGTQNHLPIYLSYRHQWAGLATAPTTYSLSFHQPMGDNVGMGAMLIDDNSGRLSKTSFQLSYAYRFSLTKQSKLSFGLSGMFSQWQADYSDVIVLDDNDPLFVSSNEDALSIDAVFGAYLYNPDYFIGISVPQLFQSKLYYGNASIPATSSNRKLLLNSGYHLGLNASWVLTPSLLFQAEKGTPLRWDVNAIAEYNDYLQLGVIYRNQKAASAIVGISFSDFVVGYVADFSFNDLGSNTLGSHELIVGYKRTLGERKKQRLERLKLEREEKRNLDTDGDGIINGEDNCPNSFGLLADGGCPVITESHVEQLSVILSEIYFVDGDISTKSMPALMKLGNLLLKEQGLQLSVEGKSIQTDIVRDYLTNRWSINKERVRPSEAAAFNLRLLAD